MTESPGSTKKVLFVYTTESHTGIAGKAKKIEEGFRDAGFDVDCLYFHSSLDRSERLKAWGLLNWKYLNFVIRNNYQIIYVRYAYYFAGIYALSGIFRKKLQIEINSNVNSEFIKKNQKVRAILNSLVESIAVRSSQRIHVVSRQLLREYKAAYPTAEIVFNSNFVVEEIDLREKESTEITQVDIVFLGNTAQPWHGIDKFIETVVVGNAWFSGNCRLHLIGRCSKTTEQLIQRCNLSEVIICHGFLTGEKKISTLQDMDIGIGGFDLGVIGLTETTGIKNGEYLHCGLSLILGYVDPSIPPTLPFVLSIDINDAETARGQIKTFVEGYRKNPSVRKAAHDFARSNLLVEHYINKIVADHPVSG